MGSTATATREIFYLVEQPGRFLFKAGATDDWETASDELTAGPAWRTCIVVRVNDADQLCRLIGRKYSDRLHGDSGWLALMPDQIQSVRSYALKAGDDFRRANPGRPATPPRPRRKPVRPPEPARAAAAGQKAQPAGGSTRRAAAEPKKEQPADGPFWGQEAARRAAAEAKAKAEQHWSHGTQQQSDPPPKQEPEPQPQPQGEAAATPRQAPKPQPAPAVTWPLWRITLAFYLLWFGVPTFGLLVALADSLQTSIPAAVTAHAPPSLSTEQALAAIDRLRAEDDAQRARTRESQWERLQQEEQWAKVRARMDKEAAERELSNKAFLKRMGVEDRGPAKQSASTWDPLAASSPGLPSLSSLPPPSTWLAKPSVSGG